MVMHKVVSAGLVASANTASREQASACARQGIRVVPAARIAAASIARQGKASVSVVPDPDTDAPIAVEREQGDIRPLPPLQVDSRQLRSI